MDYLAFVGLCEEAGLFEAGNDPRIAAACRWYMVSGDPSQIDLLLRYDPLLAHYAGAFAAVKAKAKMDDPFWPGLSGDEAADVGGGYGFGVVNSAGDSLCIRPADFTGGVFLCGGSGRGKSYPVHRLFGQLLAVPPGERGFTVLIVQAAKREADFFCLRFPWLKVINWPDLRYSLFEVADWDDAREKVEHACRIFAVENYMYSLSGPPLRYAVLRACEHLKVFSGSKRFPLLKEIRDNLYGYMQAYGIRGNDMSSTIGKVVNRLVEFEMEGDVLNVRRGFPFGFWTENDVCLNVIGRNEFCVRTVLMTLLSDLQRYYMKLGSASGLRCLLVVDEARWLFDVARDRQEVAANRIVETFFTTSRESGFGRLIVTQEPQSVSAFVPANCWIVGSFPIGGDGLAKAREILGLSEEEARALMFGQGERGRCVMVHPRVKRPFVVFVPPDGGLVKGDIGLVDRAMEGFVLGLHLEVERLNKEGGGGISGAGLVPEERSVLELLGEFPFLSLTELRNASRLHDRIEEVLSGLVGKGLVSVVRFSLRGPKTRYFPLTVAAQDLLGIPKPARVDESRFLHAMFCELVVAWLSRSGLTGVREYGRGGLRADVWCEETMTAFEVTRSFGNVAENVAKCFDALKAERVFVVCEDKAGCVRAEGVVRSGLGERFDGLGDRLQYVSIRSFA